MSPQEFKSLDSKFVEALRVKLPDSDIKVVQDPFRGKMVGVSFEKGGNLFEIYSLKNNGEEVSWSYLGDGQL